MFGVEAVISSDDIEDLQHRLQVEGWTSEGIQLADGRVIPLPGIEALPSDSVALAQATRRGVELNSYGRVIGLVRVHHWCGNDPVRNHVARVDLAHLLMFFGEGRFDLPEAVSDYPNHASAELAFTDVGWNVSEFGNFAAWSRFLTAHGS